MSCGKNTLSEIKDNNIKWVDLRFTDFVGKEHHVTLNIAKVTESLFDQGHMFDGSSLIGWQPIHLSDMIMLPDDATSVIDPFAKEPTLNLRCDIIDPRSQQSYACDPRHIAKQAAAYLQFTGIADTAYFGSEQEFFIFDDAKWSSNINQSMYLVNSVEGSWNSGSDYASGNMGHRNRVQGGYSPVPPVDSSYDLRTAMCSAMLNMGLKVELHHHEVATGCQNEISTEYNSLVAKADEVQTLKYCVHNVAAAYGKTATFMPKPLAGDNGSGMHVHQSLFKKGKNIFAGNQYADLSEVALFYIGGIIKHARALNAFTNPSTNSYKRLVPGFEAPVALAYSRSNRSAAIRIPYNINKKSTRIELRFPDNTANPYLAFAAMLMAGIDGIQNKIDPGEALDKNLYDLSQEENNSLPKVADSLSEALAALDMDREFLIVGGVFSNKMLDKYMQLKQADITKIDKAIHPLEFEMYYSL